MNRPLYETGSDRQHEEEVIAHVTALTLSTGWVKLSMGYGLDYAVTCGRHVDAFCEVKCRPGLAFGYGDGYYLSVLKVMRAREIHAATKRPCYLAVRFSAGDIWTCDLLSTPADIIIAGRTDRGDQYDQEPCVIYPWRSFIKTTP